MSTCGIRRFALTAMFLSLPAAWALAGAEETARRRGSDESAQPEATQKAAPAPQAAEEGDLQRPLRLYFAVMEIRLSATEMELIHASPAAVNLAALAKNAAAEGRANTRHVFDQPVQTGTEVSLSSGARIPVVRTTGSGKSRQTTMDYQEVGCNVDLFLAPLQVPSEDEVRTTWNMEVSYVAVNAHFDADSGVAAPVSSKLRRKFQATLTIGKDEYFGNLFNATIKPDAPGEVTLVHVFVARLDAINGG